MIDPLSPAALLALLADGLDDSALDLLGTAPAVVVDLSEPAASGDLRRALALLAAAPVVLVGVASDGIGDVDTALGLDVLVCGAEDALAPWVACGDRLDEAVESLVRSITASPHAAVALAQLLRVSEPATPASAVVAESWVYSLLQGGPEHREWLATRAARTARPRPHDSVVRLERHGDELVIALDRPEVHNAYGARMRDELVEAFRLVDIDRSIVRVVLRGNGPSFSSGGDLDEFGTAPVPIEAHDIRTRRNAGIALAAIAERVEVQVHGQCVGAGVELPAFAARVLAHPDTTFLLPEIGMGLVPGAGGTSSIPRRIGRHRTAYLALCGRPIETETALAWGLIDGVDDTIDGSTDHHD